MYKKYLIVIFIGNLVLTLNAQSTTKYEHCNCVETINYSKTDRNLKDGKYELICDKIFVEAGNYKQGHKDGIWTVKNLNGTKISEIVYSNGILNGNYKLFYYEGDRKLEASFENNLPIGQWTYFSKKGKIIKQGNYKKGSAVGIWKIYNKNGKKVIFEYDFDKKKSLISSNYKSKNPFLPRDDESGEYIIIYSLNKPINSQVKPFGGYTYSNELFVELLNVPLVMMNTFANFEFQVKANVKNGALMVDDVNYSMHKISETPYFSYIAQTNSPKKIKRIKHNNLSITKVKERIFETLMILGPWIGESENELEISVPFVLNEIDGM
jgi:antitoxin component YwqK of YwqJK toxin-antitoxin module